MRSVLAVVFLLPLVASCGGATAGSNGVSIAACTVPALPGSIVHVELADAGGGMMSGSSAGMGNHGSADSMPMELLLDKTSVVGGQPVSFIAVNQGSLLHELVILQLPAGSVAGSVGVGADRKADEGASRGEASKACGSGPGAGLVSGATGWVTVTLQPGAYAVICNEPGHYTSGMRAQFVVR